MKLLLNGIFDLPDTVLIRTLLLLLTKLFNLPCVYIFSSPDLLSFLICKERAPLVLPSVFFPFHCLPPHAVAFGMGEDVCRAEQPVKGIFKALSASQLFCSLSAGAAFCRRFLHETFCD